MLLNVLYLQKKEVETISIIIMEQIVLSLKQLSDNKWMDALSDDRQYMFVIRPKKEWTYKGNEVYDMVSDISGRFVGSTIVLVQKENWVIACPKIILEWLPNLQLISEEYRLSGVRIPRIMGLLLSTTHVVRSKWTFLINDVKVAEE
jgi:hypothetical protein